jgi:glucose/arabinose dehydrogenase
VSVALGDARSSPATAPRLALSPVPGRFRAPVYVTAPAGELDRIYVAQQDGVVRVIDNGRFLRQPFLDLHRQVLDQNLAGLLSIAFPSDYARSRRVYVDYVGRDQAIHVVEFHTTADRAIAATARELLRVVMGPAKGDEHYGGQLAFGRDGRLYVGVGDGLHPASAQEPTDLLGKLVRLDARVAHPQPQIVAFGLRNPWRFSFDAANGDLYIGDVGADTWEEIDYLPHGTPLPVDFGWPAYGGRVRTAAPAPTAPGHLLPPILTYRHLPGRCSAVVGGYVYHGTAIPSLRGRYVYADFCDGTIHSLRVKGTHATAERLEGYVGHLTASFGRDARGELYVCAYTYTTSRIYQLRPAQLLTHGLRH